jgi:hypothetical protein
MADILALMAPEAAQRLTVEARDPRAGGRQGRTRRAAEDRGTAADALD